MKKAAAVFLFLVLNGTWAMMAYLLYLNGVAPSLIAIVITIGVLLGNVAGYVGLRIAGKLLRKSGAQISN